VLEDLAKTHHKQISAIVRPKPKLSERREVGKMYSKLPNEVERESQRPSPPISGEGKISITEKKNRDIMSHSEAEINWKRKQMGGTGGD